MLYRSRLFKIMPITLIYMYWDFEESTYQINHFLLCIQVNPWTLKLHTMNKNPTLLITLMISRRCRSNRSSWKHCPRKSSVTSRSSTIIMWFFCSAVLCCLSIPPENTAQQTTQDIYTTVTTMQLDISKCCPGVECKSKHY